MNPAKDEAINAQALLQAVAQNHWCIIPPNQETPGWSIYQRFDGEFGYEDEIATGRTVIEAITSACVELSQRKSKG